MAATRVKVLARGTRLRLRDVHGTGCAHVLLWRADAPWERLNVADTVKVPWQAYLGVGHPLLSDQGRVLATVVADTSGHHDALCGTTTLAGNTAKYGAGEPESASPAGRELLALAAFKQGLGRRDLAPSLSFFHGVRVGADGALESTGSAGAGAYVDLLVHLPVVGRDRQHRPSARSRTGIRRRAGRGARLGRRRGTRSTQRRPVQHRTRVPAGLPQLRGRLARRPSARGEPMTTILETAAAEPALVPGQVILDEIVAARAPWSAIVAAGDVLTIVDLHGNQAVDTLFYGAHDHAVRYSAAVTIAMQAQHLSVHRVGAPRQRRRAR